MDTPDDTTLKRCSKCGETKPRDQFNRQKSNKDGLSFWCRECNSINCRQYYAKNREAQTASSRQYYAEHREKEAERNRKYRAKNQDSVQKQRRQYRAEHRDQLSERNRTWKANNREWLTQYFRQYYTENTEKVRARERLRRARKVGASGSHTTDDLAAIRAAQTNKRGQLICWRCGKPIKDTPHLDHWIPLKHGGSNDPGNLHYMHAYCNLAKNAKHPTEIGRLL